jgi:hypothetical protein
MPVFQVGLVSAGIIFLIFGAVLAIIAARIAAAGRAAQAEASIRLEASQQLAAEVKRLADKVELSLHSRGAELENAFLRHNDACAASMEATFGPRKLSGHGHDDDDHHKKHHSAAAKPHHGDDDDHHHKKHHAAAAKPHHDDDDDDHHHQKHHAADEPKPSILARLFGRR